MTQGEAVLEVDIFDAVFGDDVGERTMMAYKHEGEWCIAFAAQGADGLWQFAPFPPHLLECEECLDDLVSALREKGYTLVRKPEQTVRTC